MKYFDRKEFKMGDKIVFDKMNVDFLLKLDMLREEFGLPMMITSSYRDEEYCKDNNIKYLKNSQHNTGNAVDIDIARYTGYHRKRLMSIAVALGLTVGVSKKFWHLDNRNEPTIYGY